MNTKRLLIVGNPPSQIGQPHWVFPDREGDLRKHMNFVTAPSLESEQVVVIHKKVDILTILKDPTEFESERKAKGKGSDSTELPESGDIYDVYLVGDCHIKRWSWGHIRDEQGSTGSRSPQCRVLANINLGNHKFSSTVNGLNKIFLSFST